MSQHARVLGEVDVRRLLKAVACHRYPARDTIIVLLSFKAGLRACEIAGLEWSMVLTTNGRVAPLLALSGRITKNGHPRQVPVHPELRIGLQALLRTQLGIREGPVLRSERGGARMTARSIVNWFGATYAALGLTGCSSHSGRRTFITSAARMIARTGGSLRDVQELVGHRDLATTQRYIEGDRKAQHKLVRLL